MLNTAWGTWCIMLVNQEEKKFRTTQVVQKSFNILPSAVTPGSTTNTVVLAIILVLSSSSSEAEVGAGRERPVSESGSVTHRGSSQSSLSQSRMSHWRWTVLESGNRNMEYRREVDTPRLGSNRNWVNTFLSGHLRQKDIFIWAMEKYFWHDDFTRCYWGVWLSCSCHWRQNSFELWFHIYLK